MQPTPPSEPMSPPAMGADTDSDADSDGNEADADQGCLVLGKLEFCGAVCREEGSTAECPAGNVCKRIHGKARRCLLLCDAFGACPPNTTCESVAGSSHRACEPKH